MDTTEHDLKLLSIGYFVQGGIVTFYALLAACYVGFLGAIFAIITKSASADQRNHIPPGLLPVIAAIGTAIVCIALAAGVCLLYAGVSLRKRRNRTFLLVMATLSCLFVPYGTILGIFTFIVLQRPTARALFGGEQPPPLPQPR